MKEHSAEFNSQHFDRPEAWPDDGANWSVAWGSPKRQWERTIFPRIRMLARGTIVDLGCGHGRWTPFIRQLADEYIGVDASQGCIDFCQARYGGRFLKCDGKTLPIESDSVDFVYSFDSLVHADLESTLSYIRECYRVLRKGGSFFLHLSTFATSGATSNDGWRSEDGDWEKYVLEVLDLCPSPLIKVDGIAWMQRSFINDCFVTFVKGKAGRALPMSENFIFMDEANDA